MIKKMLALLLALVMVIGLVACGGSEGESAKPEAGKAAVKIAIVCDASGQNDNGYNQSAVEGAKECAETLGVEYKVVEPTESIGNTLAVLAEDGYNLIFSMEYDFDALEIGRAHV